jgi:hypothetical protein
MKKLLLISTFLLATIATNGFGMEGAQLDNSAPNRIFLKVSTLINFVASENSITINFPKEFVFIKIEGTFDNFYNKTADIRLNKLQDLLKKHFYSLEKINDKVFNIVKQENCPTTLIKNWSWY